MPTPQDIPATDLEQETLSTLDGSEQFVMFDSTKGKRASVGDIAKYAVGDKTQLQTTDKSSVVGAINEVNGKAADLKEDLNLVDDKINAPIEGLNVVTMSEYGQQFLVIPFPASYITGLNTKVQLDAYSDSANSTHISMFIYEVDLTQTGNDRVGERLSSALAGTLNINNWAHKRDAMALSHMPTTQYVAAVIYTDNDNALHSIKVFNLNINGICVNQPSVMETPFPYGTFSVTPNIIVDYLSLDQYFSLIKQVDKNSDDIYDIIQDIGIIKIVVDDNSDFVNTNQSYKTDGTQVSYGGWNSTDYIDCHNFDKVAFDLVGFNGNGIVLSTIAFFDESKVFNGYIAIQEPASSGKAFSGEEDIPSTAYYLKALGHTSLQPNPKVTLIKEGAVTDSEFLMKRNDATRNSDLKIACIGDSLTLGIDVGSHVIAESYPFFMKEYLDCDILNCGKSGMTSKGWWDSWRTSFTFDSSIDVALIMFGTNGGLAVNTLATDVEPYDDYADYADTSVGCYCKIIEYLMEQTDNHAQIILLTPPYSTYTSAQEQLVIDSNPVVKAIAKRYQLPVIDVLNESGMGKFNGDVFRPHDGCHFNAKGYHKLGTFIGSQVRSLLSWFNLDDVYDDETPLSD